MADRKGQKERQFRKNMDIENEQYSRIQYIRSCKIRNRTIYLKPFQLY